MPTLADLLRQGSWNDGSTDEKRQLVDALRATPRNEVLGTISDAMNSGINWMRSPERTQQMQGLGAYFESTGIPKTTERMAYGEPLTNIGKANVPLMKPETAEAIMNVAPLVPAAKFLPKNVPVGMGIKPVTGVFARESFVPGVEAGKEMIVHHNISPEKLAKVEKVGGMPVPSIAVSNVENPLSNFGDISLIGPKEMATPSAKNPVFGFDAYTAKAPRIDYEIDPKSQKNLTKLFSDVYPQSSYETHKLVQDWDNREFSKLYKEKFLKEQGSLPNRSDFKDDWEYSRAVGEAVDNRQAQYKDWINEFEKSLPDAGVNVKERIFKGFTDSGNRKYVPATLDNYVKEMKGGAGSEGIMYGAGSLRAVAAPKFRTFNQVKGARENLVTSEQMKPLKEQIDSEMDTLSSKLSGLQDQAGYGYSPSDALYEIAQTKNVNLLDKLYKDVPDSLKDDVRSFIGNLQKMPSEYFEIKPQRAVQVNEFKGAILPADVPKQSVDYLRKQGLQDLYYYSTPEERKELFKKFGPEMFATMPLGIFGKELPEMKEQK
jgi:hypothetical protein